MTEKLQSSFRLTLMIDIVLYIAIVVYIPYIIYTVCKTAKKRKKLLKSRDKLTKTQVKKDLKRLNQLINLYLK